jgi:hypothetical protein
MKGLVVGQDLLSKDVACAKLDLSGSKVQSELRLHRLACSENGQRICATRTPQCSTTVMMPG